MAPSEPEPWGTLAEELSFHSRGLRLAGTLHRPATSAPCPALVVLHAAGGGARDYPFYRHLADTVPQCGIAVLLYDRRGSGQSEGDFNTASFADLAADGAAAFDALRLRPDIDGSRIGLYGISQGGWIAPLVARGRPMAASLIVVSGCGVSPAAQMDYAAAFALREQGLGDDAVAKALALRGHVNDYYRGTLDRATVTAAVESAADEPWFPYAFIDTAGALPVDVTADKWWYEFDYDPLPVWAHLRQPVLFLFAAADRWVPVFESMALLRGATAHLPDVTFAQIPGTDHLMAESAGDDPAHVSERYLSTVLAWLTERLGSRAPG